MLSAFTPTHQTYSVTFFLQKSSTKLCHSRFSSYSKCNRKVLHTVPLTKNNGSVAFLNTPILTSLCQNQIFLLILIIFIPSLPFISRISFRVTIFDCILLPLVDVEPCNDWSLVSKIEVIVYDLISRRVINRAINDITFIEKLTNIGWLMSIKFT